jgi:hypothetical protein
LNSTSEKIYSEVSVHFETLKEKNKQYYNQLNTLETRLKSKYEQKSRIKKQIKSKCDKLHQMLDLKEKQLLSNVEKSQEFESIESEYLSFKEWVVRSNYLLKKCESVLSLNHDSFMFILEGLSLSRKLETLLTNQLISSKTKNSLDKTLSIEHQMESIQQMFLNEPFDVQNCFVTSEKSFKGQLEEGIEFTLHVLNKNGKMASKEFLEIYPFQIDVTSSPLNSVVVIEKKIISNGQLFFHLKGEKLGEYNLRVHMFDIEVKGSPMVAEIIPEKRYDLIRGETVTDEWTWSHEGVEAVISLISNLKGCNHVSSRQTNSIMWIWCLYWNWNSFSFSGIVKK